MTENLEVRNQYKFYGSPDEYYKKEKENYHNPHFEIVKKLLLQFKLEPGTQSVIDLCCGNGEVTSVLSEIYPSVTFTGVDPYLDEIYKRKQKRDCLKLSFKDLATDFEAFPQTDVIVCSFALHLCPTDLLPTILFNLASKSKYLVILTPNKKPDIHQFWELIETQKEERVTMKIYESQIK